MTTANGFMEELKDEHPDLWSLMQEAQEKGKTASEFPWLADGAVTRMDDGTPVMSGDNPVRIIKDEMDRAFDYRRNFKEAAECSNRITGALGRPLMRMLQDLEPGAEDPDRSRKAAAHGILERAVKDQLVDFAGHLWDVSPMETTEEFAERLMLARQAIERAGEQGTNG